MTQTATQDANVIANGAKLLGEVFIPGASLLMEGKFLNGIAHTAAGIGARLALGPVGLALVCADSFSKATTDKFLWDHVSETYNTCMEKRKATAAEKAAKLEAAAQETAHETVATAA
jgi:hypothetical protein